MPIQFRCIQCRHRLQTADDTAGKRARCPQCGAILDVPGGSALSAAAAADGQPEPAGNPFRRAPVAAANAYAPPQSGPGLGAASPLSPAAVKARVQGPALALIIISVVGLLFAALMVLGFVLAVIEEGLDDDDVAVAIFVVVMAVSHLVVLVGAIQMLRLKSYTLAVTAAVLSLVPCQACWCLEVGFGVWALVVLLDDRVRANFS